MALVRPAEAVPLLDSGVERSRVERSKLWRELGRLDAVCLLIAAIVVMDTLGVVAHGGAQTAALLMIVAALNFVPAGMVTADPDAYLPDGFAADRLGFTLTGLLPLAAMAAARIDPQSRPRRRAAGN